MVLRFDGNPGIGANLFSEVDNLICLRHLLISTLVVHSNILYIMILKLDGNSGIGANICYKSII